MLANECEEAQVSDWNELTFSTAVQAQIECAAQTTSVDVDGRLNLLRCSTNSARDHTFVRVVRIPLCPRTNKWRRISTKTWFYFLTSSRTRSRSSRRSKGRA